MENRKLSPRTQGLLHASADERIKHIDKPFFIPYSRAADILDEMEDLLEHPKTNRMPNILILGRSNNGKTEILREFLKRHPAEERAGFDRVYAPVVYVQSPPGPTEHIFLNKLLVLLGAPVKQNHSSDRKLIQLMELLRSVQTKILMIDELNALLAGSVTKQRFFLNMLKYISNDLQISIVAAGTAAAENAVNSDDQIRNRFPTRILPRWKENKSFQELLFNFEYVLPLKQASDIYKGEISKKIFGLSEGVIGEVATILRSSAKFSIESGEEKITMDTLRNCAYVTRKISGEEEII